MSVSHSQQKHCWENTHAHTHMDGRTVFSENTPSILSQQDSKAPENKETITLLYYSDTGIYSCQSTTSLRQGNVFLWKTLSWVGVCAARNDKPAGLAQLFDWIHTQANKQEAACFSGGLFDSCINSKWGSHANTVAGLSDASSEQLSKLLVSRSQLHAGSN